MQAWLSSALVQCIHPTCRQTDKQNFFEIPSLLSPWHPANMYVNLAIQLIFMRTLIFTVSGAPIRNLDTPQIISDNTNRRSHTPVAECTWHSENQSIIPKSDWGFPPEILTHNFVMQLSTHSLADQHTHIHMYVHNQLNTTLDSRQCWANINFTHTALCPATYTQSYSGGAF